MQIQHEPTSTDMDISTKSKSLTNIHEVESQVEVEEGKKRIESISREKDKYSSIMICDVDTAAQV